MNLEQLIQLVLSNPAELSILYELINGKERLVVNGEDLTLKEKETFDDSGVLELIKNYKESIELLDDCVFMDTIDEIEKTIDLKKLDEALNKDHFTEKEAEEIESCIKYINSIIHHKLSDKIQQSIELLERF